MNKKKRKNLKDKKRKINKKASKYKYILTKHWKFFSFTFLLSSMLLISNLFFNIPTFLSLIALAGVVSTSSSVYLMDNYISKKDKKNKKIDKVISEQNKEIPINNNAFTKENNFYGTKKEKNKTKNHKKR